MPRASRAGSEKSRADNKRFRENNPDYFKLYHRKNKARHKASVDRWRKENPGAERAAQLKFKYGMSVAAYEAMLIAQSGRCAVCGTPATARRVLHVDHCHAEGHVRGLLCVQCNTGLGHFKDDPTRLQSAIAYLEEA